MFLFLGSTLGTFGWCVSGIFFSLKFSSVKRVVKRVRKKEYIVF